jgi:hypothetical protein
MNDDKQMNETNHVDSLLGKAKGQLAAHKMPSNAADQALSRLQAQLQLNVQNTRHQEALAGELALAGQGRLPSPFASFQSVLFTLGVIVLAIALTILGWRSLRGSDSAGTSLASAPATASPVSPPIARSDLDSSPFFALVSDQELNAYQERARVVSTRVPNVVLASYGVPTPPQYADGDVRVDWLVSASGRKLAVRMAD